MTSAPPPDGLDPDEPLDADAEAVLAVADDTATPEQRRRVARDPELRAVLAELTAAVTALAEPVEPPDDDTFARLRAAALDADAEEPADDDEQPGEPADDTVLPLAPGRARRARRLPPWPAVAAAVLLLLGLGSALILNDRASDDPGEAVASEADDGDAASNEEAQDLGASAAESPGPPEASGSEPVPAESGRSTDASELDLPEYADEEALRRALEAVDPLTLQPPGAPAPTESTSAYEATSTAGALCTQGLEAVDPAIGPPHAALLVRVDGAERLVLSNPVEATADAPSTTRLTVFEPNGCVPLFAVQR
jgi:hypothetical protein